MRGHASRIPLQGSIVLNLTLFKWLESCLFRLIDHLRTPYLIDQLPATPSLDLPPPLPVLIVLLLAAVSAVYIVPDDLARPLESVRQWCCLLGEGIQFFEDSAVGLVLYGDLALLGEGCVFGRSWIFCWEVVTEIHLANAKLLLLKLII